MTSFSIVVIALVAWTSAMAQAMTTQGPPPTPPKPPCFGLPCAPPPRDCIAFQDTIVIQNGMECPGCPICILRSTTQAPPPTTSKPPCLGLPCAPLPDDLCVASEPTTVIQNGMTCPGCPRCITREEVCVEGTCPPQPPNCSQFVDATVSVIFRRQRVTCPCKRCVRVG